MTRVFLSTQTLAVEDMLRRPITTATTFVVRLLFIIVIFIFIFFFLMHSNEKGFEKREESKYEVSEGEVDGMEINDEREQGFQLRRPYCVHMSNSKYQYYS